MKGSDVFTSVQAKVPPMINDILEYAGVSKEEIEYYLFHQPNKFLLEFLQMKCDLIGYPFWNDVKEYGNTVSSSIPITIKDMLQANQEKRSKKFYPLVLAQVYLGQGVLWILETVVKNKYC